MRRKTLYVISGNTKAPFLRGFLTQSLIDAGLNFEDAYDIANLMRDRFKSQKSITAKKLKQLVYEHLNANFGEEVAKRYLDDTFQVAIPDYTYTDIIDLLNALITDNKLSGESKMYALGIQRELNKLTKGNT